MGRLLGTDATTLPGQPLAQWFKVDDGNGGVLTDTLAKVALGPAWHGRLNYASGGDRVAIEVMIEADTVETGQFR
jgi:hypothetical protein